MQPPSAQPPQFDFARPFTFVFQDPKWVSKIAMGGLFTLASVFIVGMFFVLGYCARLARNVIAGEPYPLPEWDDLSEYFSEGLRLWAVAFVYWVPLAGIMFVGFVPMIIAGASRNEVLQHLSGGMFSCLWCFIVPLSFLYRFYIPSALLMTAVEGHFGAGFELQRNFRFIRYNFINYLLAFVVYMVAGFITPFGLIFFCIGIFFLAFWAMVVAAYSYAETYRLATVK